MPRPPHERLRRPPTGRPIVSPRIDMKPVRPRSGIATASRDCSRASAAPLDRTTAGKEGDDERGRDDQPSHGSSPPVNQSSTRQPSPVRVRRSSSSRKGDPVVAGDDAAIGGEPRRDGDSAIANRGVVVRRRTPARGSRHVDHPTECSRQILHRAGDLLGPLPLDPSRGRGDLRVVGVRRVPGQHDHPEEAVVELADGGFVLCLRTERGGRRAGGARRGGGGRRRHRRRRGRGRCCRSLPRGHMRPAPAGSRPPRRRARIQPCPCLLPLPPAHRSWSAVPM